MIFCGPCTYKPSRGAAISVPVKLLLYSIEKDGWHKDVETAMEKTFANAHLLYAMKTYGGSGCTDPRFLDLGNSWR
jgi:hypothetical protein